MGAGLNPGLEYLSIALFLDLALHKVAMTEIADMSILFPDTTQYIPTIQKLSRLEQKSNEVETQAHKAQEKVVTLEEDVRSLRGQMAILNQAALKMEYENKSKGNGVFFRLPQSFTSKELMGHLINQSKLVKLLLIRPW